MRIALAQIKMFHLRNTKMKEELTKLLGNRDVEIVIEKYE